MITQSEKFQSLSAQVSNSTMATAFSLCSSVTLNFSDNGSAASVSQSRTNLSFISRSLSSLSLTSRKGSASAFTAKSGDTETAAAVDLSESETENPVPVSDVAVETGEKKREDVFAVVMVGSRQYIVFPGRFIYTQRLKGANVNDKITLNKVLLVGTKTSTYIGKPIVPNATVEAVVEEQTLDKKVIVFKYKKKKNYRRNIGHRQPITRIRVTSINGYQNSPSVTLEKALTYCPD